MKRAALLFVMLAACGGPTATKGPTPATTQGKPAGPAPSPLVEVGAASVTLDGAIVADAKAIEGAGKPQRLDALFDRLKERRARFATEHPGEPIPTGLWLDVSASPGHASALSALLSAAFAGYHRVHFKTAEGWVDAEYDVPGPTETRVTHARVVMIVSGDGMRATFQTDRACDATPEDAQITVDGAAAHFAKVCKEKPCADHARIAFGPGVKLETVIRALAAIRAQSSETMRFALLHFGDPKHLPPLERKCGAPLPAPGGDHAGVRAKLREAQPQLRACYKKATARDPKLEGVVALKVTIGTSGKVDDAQLDARTTLNDKEVSECMLGVVRAITFPPQEKPTPVTVPMRFSPDDLD